MSEPPAAVPPRTPAPVASVGRAVAACALYGTSSVAITFFNKAVFSVFHFHYPVFMTLVQILFCLAALRIANALGLAGFGVATGLARADLWGLLFVMYVFLTLHASLRGSRCPGDRFLSSSSVGHVVRCTLFPCIPYPSP